MRSLACWVAALGLVSGCGLQHLGGREDAGTGRDGGTEAHTDVVSELAAPDGEDTPDVPVMDTPDVMDVPDVPVMDMPDVPVMDTPDVPDVRVMDVPDVPDVPVPPDVPDVPDVPVPPDVPAMCGSGPACTAGSACFVHADGTSACGPCGGAGQQCCPGSACAAGTSCTPVALQGGRSLSVCLLPPSMTNAGSPGGPCGAFGGCGFSNATCVGGGGGSPGVCLSCGGLGEICCPDPTRTNACPGPPVCEGTGAIDFGADYCE